MTDPLPATTYSELLPMTEAQKVKLAELTALGWEAVTPPEGTFNGAMLVEGPERTHYLYPDGSIS